MKNLPRLTNSLVKERNLYRWLSNWMSQRRPPGTIRILEAKAPIQFISYLPGIKGKSFSYSEAMQVSKKTWDNS